MPSEEDIHEDCRPGRECSELILPVHGYFVVGTVAAKKSGRAEVLIT